METKRKLAAALTAGLLLAFLLLAISYAVFPNDTSQTHSLGIGSDNDIFWAIVSVGLAALIAVAVVGLLLGVTKLKQRKVIHLREYTVIYYSVL